MQQIIHLYLDESGTRYPDHTPGTISKYGHDYFALGGILIRESDEPVARQMYSDFCHKWEIDYPLHSVEIRGTHKNFAWLGTLSESEKSEFLGDLEHFILQVPVVGIACVVDRPGYNRRYEDRYGQKRWLLCKTAFTILVERSAKYAKAQDCKLRVLPERCTKEEDAILKGYYNDLKRDGMPFSQATSSAYKPLASEDFSQLLYEFKPKYKSSPMAQLADLYLWPMAIGGYDKNNYPYQRLLSNRKLIDCFCTNAAIPHLGIKYSCFERFSVPPT